MGQKSIIVNTPNKKNHSDAQDWAAVFNGLYGGSTGILPIGSKLVVGVNDEFVIINDGVFSLSGHMLRVKEGTQQFLKLPETEVGKKRIAYVVAQYVVNAKMEDDVLEFAILAGEPDAINPLPPQVTTGNIDKGDRLNQAIIAELLIDGNKAEVNRYGKKAIVLPSLVDDEGIISKKIEGLRKELNYSVEITPEQFGALGHPNDDTSCFINMFKNAKGKVINMRGKTYTVSSLDIPEKTHMINGKINLKGEFKLSNGNNSKFESIEFIGEKKSRNGIIMEVVESNVIGNRFYNCYFQDFKSAILSTADGDNQQNTRIENCTFNRNDIGVDILNAKRVHIVGNHFVGNGIGVQSDITNYHGLGLNIINNYINGNLLGVKILGGMYDMLISGNTFDHNSFVGGVGEVDYGGNLELNATKVIDNTTITGNKFRGSPIGIKMLGTGAIRYSSITSNLFSQQTLYSMQIKGKELNFGTNDIIGNKYGKPNDIELKGEIGDANANWSAFDGGTVRGKTDFVFGFRIKPIDKLLYNKEDGYLTYHDGTAGFKGLYVVEDNKHMYIQTTQAGGFRPAGKPNGFVYYDTNLNKPIWFNGGKWRDANGTIV